MIALPCLTAVMLSSTHAYVMHYAQMLWGTIAQITRPQSLYKFKLNQVFVGGVKNEKCEQ